MFHEDVRISVQIMTGRLHHSKQHSSIPVGYKPVRHLLKFSNLVPNKLVLSRTTIFPVRVIPPPVTTVGQVSQVGGR